MAGMDNVNGTEFMYKLLESLRNVVSRNYIGATVRDVHVCMYACTHARTHARTRIMHAHAHKLSVDHKYYNGYFTSLVGSGVAFHICLLIPLIRIRIAYYM